MLGSGVTKRSWNKLTNALIVSHNFGIAYPPQSSKNARGLTENARECHGDVAHGCARSVPNVMAAAPNQPGKPSHMHKPRSLGTWEGMFGELSPNKP